MSATVTLLEAALDYAHRGWPVLPLHTPTDGRCSCSRADCDGPGKHPRITDWPNQATTDPATIQRWWTKWPDANIAIVTGARSGLLVVDGDPRHGGDDTLRKLEVQHDPVPATVESCTGGGGFHKLYKYPGPVKSGAGALGPGLDIKADGGYIVAPPSLHLSGLRYCWEAASHPDENPIAEAPAWLLTMLTAKSNGNGQERRTQAYWLALLQGAPDGKRYDLATQIAGHFLGIGRSVEEVEALILGYLSQCTPPGDAEEREKARRMVRDLAGKNGATGNSNGDSLAFLRALADSPTPADIEVGLREAVKSLGRLDSLRLRTVRQEMIALLKARKVSGPARYVDLALSLIANDGGTDGEHADFLVSPEPWPEPIEGATLLDTISGVLRRYMVMTVAQADTCALWIAFAHTHDAFQVSPILAVQSPILGCGKSRLFSILEPMLPRALMACNLGAATLFRTVEKYKPTLLIDEADTFMKDNESLRGVVNSGWLRPGARTIRLVGDNHETKLFSTWCPKAIAAIGKLPSTIQDRSIVLELKRKTDEETVERFGIREANELKPLCSKAARWAKDNIEALRDATPEVPNSLGDRQADSWNPLLSVADLAGGSWPERARKAALLLSGGERDPEADGAGVALIADCVKVFETRGIDRLSTADLIAELVKIEERPWGEWTHGKPITPRGLAKLLKPFGIKPKDEKLGRKTLKGYERTAFDDAFSRYCKGSYPQLGQPVNEINELDTNSNPQPSPGVADTEQGVTIEKQRQVADVADRNPEKEAEGMYDPGFDALESVAWEAV